MQGERIELVLPDHTKLIAESESNTDYPCICIRYEDAAGNYDEVAFAEHNPEREPGQRLCVGAYQNHEEDTRHYESFSRRIQPSFSELKEFFEDEHSNDLVCVRNNEFVEIQRVYDDAILYSDFFYNISPSLADHIGHEMVLCEYTGYLGVVNISIECETCHEVIYSVDNPVNYMEKFRMCNIGERAELCYSSAKYQDACIGYMRSDFGKSGEEFYHTWFDVSKELKNTKFQSEFTAFINDYLRYNFLSNFSDMKANIKTCGETKQLGENEYAVQFIAADYTYFVRMIPLENNYNAYVYAYDNKKLYELITPQQLEFNLPAGGSGRQAYVQHEEWYRNPQTNFLSNEESDCWDLFKKYAAYVGATIDEGLNTEIIKEISQKIQAVVEKTFHVNFPVPNQINGGEL